MLNFLKDVFADGQFIPHGHCYLWKPELVGLHILSDSIIGVAYYSIPIALIYFVRKRQDLPFNWIFVLFSAFILACGTTHLMEVWTLWHPVYWLSGLFKAITALVSLYTALSIVPLIPKALVIPSPEQLEIINQELKHHIQERQQAEAALKKINEELEIRVNNRTLELAKINQELQEEIQQRLQIEATLQQKNELLQAIFDNVPVMICLFDSNGYFEWANQEFETVLGWRVEDIQGRDLLPELYPDLEYCQYVLDFITAAERRWGEFKTRTRDGRVLDTTWANVYLRDGSTVGIGKDISERKLAEQKILEQAALIDVITDAIFVCDLENHILFWSRGAEGLYGWTAEESLGKVSHEIFTTESLLQLEAGLKATLKQESWEGELEQITKTGRKIIVASRWTLLQNLFGQPQSILVVNTDITQKKQLEQQFYRAQRLESVGTLASGIAHDLNNVFSPMMMIAQLLNLKYKNVDAQTQELFKTLETNSQRGANLVKQILTFARGTEGKRILLQPGHLLKEWVKVITQTFPKSLELVTNIPTGTLWMVKANPTQLEQVFMNLAVNARDAMPNGGKLTITAENRNIDETYAQMHLEAKVGGYIVVTISDTGTGIPPEFLDRIFDPFFTTKEVGKGTGLGLSTVLGIVKNHGGFLEVSTGLGKGTEFQVFLPRGEGTAIETITKTEFLKGNGELILVVDDEVALQQVIRTTLESYNFKIFVANDGIEAINLYIKHQPEISVVLLDMLMPNMDGFITIRTLQTLNPNVKIIASSGLAANEQKAIAAGARKFLSKPYTATNLLNTLLEVTVGNR
jgi:PAS domain S-box-containing protein